MHLQLITVAVTNSYLGAINDTSVFNLEPLVFLTIKIGGALFKDFSLIFICTCFLFETGTADLHFIKSDFFVLEIDTFETAEEVVDEDDMLEEYFSRQLPDVECCFIMLYKRDSRHITMSCSGKTL